tara:strand:+ start:59 stop:919 length:861 start_codon:yes stop_codon:yes gene_type:complete
MQILATLTLILGFIAIFYGVLGVFGFSYKIQITRKQAIQVLFVGFMSLYISGIFNSNTIIENPEATNQTQPTSQTKPLATTSTIANNMAPLTSTTSSTLSNTAIEDVATKLLALTINNDFSGIPSYDRDLYFGSWTDDDGDCQNTRAEVLIIESLSTVSFRASNQCVVDSGEWLDPYTNNTYFLASDVDIDHVVPLRDAWQSGAYLWTDFKRKEFANDMIFDGHLIAVDDYENQSEKKAKNPSEWMPPNIAFHCEYVSIWIEIKYLWELTVTTAEYNFLDSTLTSC